MPFLLDIHISDPQRSLPEYFIDGPVISLQLSGNDFDFIAWGDPIADDGFSRDLPHNRSIEFIVNNLSGHFYFVLHNKINGQYLLGNSMFSILPFYYCLSEGRITASDNALTLGMHCGKTGLSKRFVLESVLFNFPLSNHSAVEGVSLLPANSGIMLDAGGIRIEKHTEVSKWFDASPHSGTGTAERLADVFLEEVNKYLPQEYFFSALTGGFDGRTLTAAALHGKRKFSCYCFGTADSRDLRVAAGTAAGVGVPFLPVNLDDRYIKDQSLQAGKRFIIESSGVGTFSRAHYLYSSELLSASARFLVTGNFGSEIFRAVHVPGVVIAPNLYRIFRSADPGESIREIRRSLQGSFLNLAYFETELADLENDIAGLPCFNASYKGLTRNMQFYIFVFEELFRKYFGTEIVVQSEIISNRTPFLDLRFLKALMSTKFAGIHSEFFEENPFRRYKGQVMYAHIIRRAFPPLGRFTTDKGYAPDDLLSFRGKLHITRGYVGKRLKKQNPMYDPNGVREAWEQNRAFYENLPYDDSLFNRERVLSSQGPGYTDLKARLFSLIYLGNYLNNQ